MRELLGFFIFLFSGKKIVFVIDINYLFIMFKDVIYWFVECNYDIKLVR